MAVKSFLVQIRAISLTEDDYKTSEEQWECLCGAQQIINFDFIIISAFSFYPLWGNITTLV